MRVGIFLKLWIRKVYNLKYLMYTSRTYFSANALGNTFGTFIAIYATVKTISLLIFDSNVCILVKCTRTNSEIAK